MTFLEGQAFQTAKFYAEKWETTPEVVHRLSLILLDQLCAEQTEEEKEWVDGMIHQFMKEKHGIETKREPWPVTDPVALNARLKALVRVVA